MIRFHISSNIDEVAGRYRKLPKKLENKSEEILNELANFVQRSAKLRAPRLTGFLASRIEARKMSRKHILVGAFGVISAYYQEKGFRPHIIPLDYFFQHYKRPDLPGYDTEWYGFKPLAYVRVSKHTPFLTPAIEQGMKRLPELAKRAIEKAIKG